MKKTFAFIEDAMNIESAFDKKTDKTFCSVKNGIYVNFLKTLFEKRAKPIFRFLKNAQN